MDLVIISQKSDQGDWARALKALDPSLNVSIYPNDTERDKVVFALAWHPPKGVFSNYPDLSCIASTGAGADHILRDPDLNPKVPVTRVVDSRLTDDMTSYLVGRKNDTILLVRQYPLNFLTISLGSSLASNCMCECRLFALK